MPLVGKFYLHFCDIATHNAAQRRRHFIPASVRCDKVGNRFLTDELTAVIVIT